MTVIWIITSHSLAVQDRVLGPWKPRCQRNRRTRRGADRDPEAANNKPTPRSTSARGGGRLGAPRGGARPGPVIAYRVILAATEIAQ